MKTVKDALRGALMATDNAQELALRQIADVVKAIGREISQNAEDRNALFTFIKEQAEARTERLTQQRDDLNALAAEIRDGNADMARLMASAFSPPPAPPVEAEATAPAYAQAAE